MKRAIQFLSRSEIVTKGFLHDHAGILDAVGLCQTLGDGTNKLGGMAK